MILALPPAKYLDWKGHHLRRPPLKICWFHEPKKKTRRRRRRWDHGRFLLSEQQQQYCHRWKIDSSLQVGNQNLGSREGPVSSFSRRKRIFQASAVKNLCFCLHCRRPPSDQPPQNHSQPPHSLLDTIEQDYSTPERARDSVHFGDLKDSLVPRKTFLLGEDSCKVWGPKGSLSGLEGASADEPARKSSGNCPLAPNGRGALAWSGGLSGLLRSCIVACGFSSFLVFFKFLFDIIN